MKRFSFLYIIVLIHLYACSSDSSMGSDITNEFDRSSMLTNWADNIIIPSYSNYITLVDAMQVAAMDFVNDPSESMLADLRDKWENSYMGWQEVALFNIGPAETEKLLVYTNIYPTDITEIKENIEELEGDYNLELSSRYDEQGYPAVEYMIYGLSSDDTELISYYTTDPNAAYYKKYLTDIATRLQSLTKKVVDGWGDGYRDDFIALDGSDASSSVNQMTNDYMYYYEKFLRAGKVGIPAGKFSSSTKPNSAEAIYHGALSKELFERALETCRNFFNGIHYDTDENGIGLKDYLDALNEDDTSLGDTIDDQFESIKTVAAQLNEDFKTQIETDKTPILETYDELQKNVINMKVDMFSLLNIQVDYVDADGD